MRRRDVTRALVGAVLLSPFARNVLAQSPPLRVGMATIAPRTAPQIVAFVARMAELGFREGENFALEHVPVADIGGYGDGFRELARRRVDIFVAFGNEVAAGAAREAAGGRPIVLLALTFDPFAKGYAQSLAHPSGNVTGLFARQLELAAKRVELLHEALPQAQGLALLWDGASRDQADAAAEAAERLGLAPRLIETGRAPDYGAALSRLSPGEALVIAESPLFVRDRAALGKLLLERRVPAIGPAREDAEAGALLAYGVNIVGALRDLADYVARIAKGASPGELPIEQPRTFDLLINLKTATALGIEIPPALIARAGEVIE